MFHWPTFTANIRRRVYTTYPAFHALTMSVCAIASARLRDGAVPSPHSSTPTSDSPPPTSEIFYQAAVSSYPRDIATASDFDYKRAKPLLATLAIQYGQIPAVHAHIGDYMTLCAIDGFHNESRWPNDLNEIEVQERRRLVSTNLSRSINTHADTFLSSGSHINLTYMPRQLGELLSVIVNHNPPSCIQPKSIRTKK